MLSKKNVLIVSLIGTLGAVILAFLSYQTPTSNCGQDMSINCWMALITLLLVIFIPVLIFSLISYRMNDGIFHSWKNWTIFLLFLYWLLVILNPWLPADYSPFEKEAVAFFSLILYFLISLILIVHKSIKLRGK